MNGFDVAGNPTPDEMAAILAALELVMAERDEGPSALAVSRWAMAGRREAQAGFPRPSMTAGWGR